MSPRPSEPLPWPAQTAAPTPSSSSTSHRKRRKVTSDHRSYVARQNNVVTDPQEVADAEYQCQVFSGNYVQSCFPDNQTIVPQHQWCTFVWNSQLPEFAQNNLVDIYLYHGDSQEQVFVMRNQHNPTGRAGFITAQANDSWWGDRGTNWNGQNVTFPFYFLVVASGASTDQFPPQPTFTAVQTTYADSVASSMSSASAASSSSAAAASSRSAASSSASVASSLHGSASTPGASGSNSSSSTGSIQGSGGSGSFSHGAIAAIVVLGFLALLASGILIFLIMRRMRNRRNNASNRESMGSSSPMMANVQGQQSPLLDDGLLASATAAAAAAAPSSVQHHDAPSLAHDDGASTISRAHSSGEAALFSGADAAIMADAFRKALRKPDFAGRPVEEGESPGDSNGNNEGDAELINRELAEEGRDIRSVSSSRGVRVETLSDAGDTAQDNPH